MTSAAEPLGWRGWSLWGLRVWPGEGHREPRAGGFSEEDMASSSWLCRAKAWEMGCKTEAG